VPVVTALLPLAAPALPLDEAGKYVAGAYVVFLVLLVVYVAIMAAKVQRIEHELRELAGFAETRSEVDGIAPGRGSEGQSISVSSGPSESRGGDA
jgi:type II secretory pathway component PulM